MDSINDYKTSCAISTQDGQPTVALQKQIPTLTGTQKSIFTVHNGIIENYEELKELVSKGYKFITETDSEIISHFLMKSSNQKHD